MGKEHSLYRKKTNYICDCCGGDTSKGVIIKDEIWKEIVDKFESRIFEDPKDNLLCINCIEKFLGRKITSDDLKPGIPLNLETMYNNKKFIMKKDLLLSTAIGDMMGVPYEFYRKAEEIVIPCSGYDYSDDTVCTFGVAKALIEGTDISKTLREVCRKEPGRGYGGMFRQWIADSQIGPYNSWGNGAPMRVSSVALMAGSEEECLEVAKKTAEITHNHPEGIKGAQAIALAIYLCLEGASKEDIRVKVLDHFYPDYKYKTYKEIPHGFDVSCQGSVPPVLVSFLESTSFLDCLKKVYALHGDTDTQGAMIAPIGYAYYGEIPEDLLEIAKSTLPEWMLEINEEYNKL